MANTPYPNYVLENKFEDQYQTYLDFMQFCTVDNSLTGEPGMKKKIRTYVATDGTETVAKGEGNTKSITASYTETEYTIETLQNRFDWYDEDEMEDPLVVDKGLEHQAVDMFNTANKKAIAEFAKATQKVETAKFDFNSFVDAVASIKDLKISESTEITGLGVFALVHKDDVAEIRKNLGELLKYVEAYARSGYIGTVAGVNIYTSALATKGQFAVATKEDEIKRSYFAGLATLPYLGWALGTFIGAILGNILPDRLMSALSVAIYGMFVAVVVPEMKKARPVLIVVIIAIILSCLFYYIPLLSKISSGITITIVAITAAIIGSIFFPVSDEADNSNN